MRILLVSHRFLPQHSAGTEVYTQELGRELVRRGHGVLVLTAEKDISRPDLSAREYEHEGLRVVEITNNLHFDDFRQTYDLPKVARFARELARKERIELVHLQHLMNLSAGLAGTFADLGLPVFMTLHDYWLSCARLGQRVHANGTLCPLVDHARCGACMSQTKWRQTPLEQRAARRLAGLRSVTGLDLAPIAVSSANLARGASVRRPALVEAQRALEYERRMDERRAYMLGEVVPRVRRFFSPSRFLAELMIEWGLPAERVEHLPAGLPSAFVPAPKTASAKLRFAFLGTLHPLKGAHVLLEAWGRLAPELRARAELALYGSARHYPEYTRDLGRLARSVGARLAGSVARADVPATLAAIDVLVVPSLWFENAPLAILEAQATRTPVLVSRLGGMQELAAAGGGWTFETGDAADLARALERLIANPAELGAAAAAEPRVPSIEEHVDRLVLRYAEPAT